MLYMYNVAMFTKTGKLVSFKTKLPDVNKKTTFLKCLKKKRWGLLLIFNDQIENMSKTQMC